MSLSSVSQAEMAEADPMPAGSGESRAKKLQDSFQLLSLEDLSTLIGVDERTLTVWRSQNRGPAAVKLGRAVFYRRTDVDAWIAQNVAPMQRP